MNMPDMVQGGLVGKPATTRSVVVYDLKDGRIVHIHHVIALEGAQPLGQGAIEAAALYHAARRGHGQSKVAALEVDPAAIKEGVSYRVDLKAGRLLERKAAPKSKLKAGRKRKATRRK